MGSRRRMFAPRPLPVEERASHERPRGHKVARLAAHPASPSATFLGLAVTSGYDTESTAVCQVLNGSLPPPRRRWRRCVPAPHAVPDLDCSCGFHAFRSDREARALLAARPPVSRLIGTVLLDVDLSGTVIECDRGFRGTHQRVLGVHVPRWCLPCATEGRRSRAHHLAGLASERLAAALRRELAAQPQLYRLAQTLHHQALLDQLAGRAVLRPVCDDHVTVATGALDGHERPPSVLSDPSDLAARLNTEVSWLDDDRFDVRTYVESLSWAALRLGYVA